MLFASVGIVGFLLVLINAKLLPVFFLLIGTLLFILDKKSLLIVLYVIYVPTNGLINRTDFIFSLLGIQQILGILTFISLLRVKVPVGSITKLQKLAVRLMMVLLVYVSYTYLKNAMFGLQDMGWTDAFKKILNVAVLYGPLVLLLRKCGSDSIKGWVLLGAFFGVINQVVYCYLSPFLPGLGFYSQGTEAFFSTGLEDDVSRYVGIMGNGDSNTLGVFFVMSIGFFLSHSASFNRSLIIKVLCGFAAVAIALTASRTAFLSLGIVGMIFLAQDGSKKVRFQLIIGALLIGAVSSPLWDTLLTRLSGAGAEQLSTDTSGNRIGKWLLYFQHFVSHPLTFLRGSSEPILIGFNNVFIAAHNFYIQVIYNAGLGILALFIMQYFNLFKLMFRKIPSRNLIYIVFPFLAITIFVSDYGIFMYFCVFLVLYTTRFAEKQKQASLNQA